MNREIKFRGLRKDGKGWVFGYLVRKPTETFIGRNILHRRAGGRKVLIYTETEIIPETVGQYTGLKDKNGVEIYEGDVVLFFTHSGEKKEKVEWHEYGMWLPFRDDEYIQDEQGDWIDHNKGFEVTGNIHQQ